MAVGPSARGLHAYLMRSGLDFARFSVVLALDAKRDRMIFVPWSRSPAGSPGRLRAGFVALVIALSVIATDPAMALPPLPPDGGDGGGESPPVGCLNQVTGTMSASVSGVTDGQSATVRWSSNVSPSCTGVTVKATGLNLFSTNRSGQQSLTPLPESNGYAMFQLNAYRNGQVKGLGNVAIRVNPAISTTFGRRTVRINHNAQVQAFVDAISVPNTTVVVADAVNLDLTGREFLTVKAGVHILGGRSSTNPGPRLFTTSRPKVLLEVGRLYQGTEADGVRISGIRIDGGEMGITDDYTSVGVKVISSVNVEIGNNEIYGWAGSAVEVRDDAAEQLQRLNFENASAVWVHDNHIHHNRHWRNNGYGVATHSGFALIERNVFDYNRHALTGDGDPGSGYLAYSNLLFHNGGENCCDLTGTIRHTHQFDVHGTEDCGFKEKYCGPAGEYFDYRYNALEYQAGDVLKVRGYPSRGADVANNTFGKCGPGTIEQTEGDNLRKHVNTFCMWVHMDDVKSDVCDFDRDGRLDDFRATGSTWWFRGNAGHWNFLNTRFTTDSDPAHDLEVRDFNGDGWCDVREMGAASVIYSGGRGSHRLVNGIEVTSVATGIVSQAGTGGGNARLSLLNAQSTGFAKDTSIPLAADQPVLGTGDFNADGTVDLLTRNAAGTVSVKLLDADGRGIAPIGGRSEAKGVMPLTTSFAGLGDFNADGRSDVLWRAANGQLIMWFAGEAGNSTKVSWQNVTDANGAPGDAPVGLDWQIKGIGDFDGDGYSDIYWKNVSGGHLSIWFMKHGMHIGEIAPGPVQQGWEIQGIGDFNADGRSDVLWRHSGGMLSLWLHGQNPYHQAPSWQNIQGHVVGPEWQVRAVADFNADGRSDILWRNTNGTLAIWHMQTATHVGESAHIPMEAIWQISGLLGKNTQRRLTMQ